MRACLPSPHRISILFLFGGKIFEFGMGDGARSGFFKEETAKTKYKLNRCLRSSYHIVSGLKGIHPRHPPRGFPLGLRAPVLGADFAERLKYQEMSRSSKNPQLVGERILLSPVRCLGSCSLRSHSAERNRARPPRPRKPLSGFSIYCLVCRFRYEILVLQYRVGARL